MEVEIIEIPESPQRVHIATEHGDAKCFIQANSWHSGCDEAWKSWNQFATGVRTQRQSVSITASTLPWHRALALEKQQHRNMRSSQPASMGCGWVTDSS